MGIGKNAFTLLVLLVFLLVLSKCAFAQSISITAMVDPLDEFVEDNEANNSETIAPEVIQTKDLHVVFRPVDFYNTENFSTSVRDMSSFIKATYPLSDQTFFVESSPNIYKTNAAERVPFIGFQLVAMNLRIQQNLTFYPHSTKIFAIVPDDWFSGNAKGQAEPKFDVFFVEPWFTNADNELAYMPSIGAHEVGHSFDYGLCDEYSYCSWLIENGIYFLPSGGCGNDFPHICDYPITECGRCTSTGNTNIQGFWPDKKREIREYSQQFFYDDINGAYTKSNEEQSKGADCGIEFVGEKFRVTCGYNFYNIMGNATFPNFRWVTNQTYERLLSKFETAYPQSPSSLPIEEQFFSSTQSLLLSGLVDKNGWVGLQDFYVLNREAEGEIPPGDYSLKLLDANSNVLLDQSFGVSFTLLSDPPVDLNTTGFVFSVPFPMGTHGIRIDFNGETKAERLVSANAPTISIVSPAGGEEWSSTHLVEWSASDADGDALSYVLQYSSDAGATWNPVAISLNGESFELDFGLLSPAEGYKLKVIATDGVLTGEAVSNEFIVRNPDIDVQPWKLDFGEVEQGAIASGAFDLVNVGNADLEVYDFNAPGHASVSGPSLPITLAPGQGVQFSVDFNTAGLEGSVDESVVFHSNDPNEAEKHFFIEGSVYIVPPLVGIDLNLPFEAYFNQVFPVRVEVSVEGAALLDANAAIVLPRGLSVVGLETVELGDVAAGETVVVDWDVVAGEAGLYEIVVVVSSRNAVDRNSAAMVAVHRMEASLDLNAGFLLGRQIQMVVSAKNYNPGVSYSDLNLLVAVKQPDSSVEEFNYYIPLLYAGEERRFTVELNAGIIGEYNIDATLLTRNGSVINTTRAEFEVLASDPCEGADSDKDGDVDLDDFARLRAEFGRTDCNANNNWCNGTDTNWDEEVNIVEYRNLVSHFGRAGCIS